MIFRKKSLKEMTIKEKAKFQNNYIASVLMAIFKFQNGTFSFGGQFRKSSFSSNAFNYLLRTVVIAKS